MLLRDIAMTMTSVPNRQDAAQSVRMRIDGANPFGIPAVLAVHDARDHGFYGDASVRQSLHNRESPQTTS